MIGMLVGTLEYKDLSTAVILAGGIGFEVQMPASELATMPPVGSEVRVYTHMSVNENTGINLVGFLTREALKMFRMLITVSGIGPKAALGILSVMDPADLSVAIMTGDEATIAKAPGIGKKIAQRIILELKDKLGANLELDFSGPVNVPAPDSGAALAMAALAELGYSQAEITAAMKKIPSDVTRTEDIVRHALRAMAMP